MAYLLDADVFIRAKRLHYGFDFCPAFWDWLITNNSAGRVFSIEKVSDWATRQGYTPAAVNTFLQVADYYLVTHALAQEPIVVTHEVASPTVNQIKIPNVCMGLGVKVMNPYEMLRLERARFILGQ